MKTYKNISFWTKEKLWKLRQEIVLNSLYLHDYKNTFEIPNDICCAFFDGYMSYLSELAENKGHVDKIEEVFAQDSLENLWDWFYCFEDCPFNN